MVYCRRPYPFELVSPFTEFSGKFIIISGQLGILPEEALNLSFHIMSEPDLRLEHCQFLIDSAAIRLSSDSTLVPDFILNDGVSLSLVEAGRGAERGFAG